VHFEDYVPGSAVTLGPVRVSREEIIEFATRYDPQPFHVDPAAAEHSPYGGIIASGWHTCALTMRLLVDSYLSADSSLGSPGLDELRWLAPVRPGDELTVHLSVLDTRPSASKPDRGIVRSRVEVVNQDATTVLSMVAVNLVRRRAEG
jgi:acyl dehydratase